MLKVNIDRKNKAERTVVMGSGELSEIINDIATVINGLYSQLKRGGHHEVAEEFRRSMVLLRVDPASVLFDVDDQADGMCFVQEGKRDA